MIFTGPGCDACNFEGSVQVEGGGPMERKPCDLCGELSLLGKQSDEVERLRASLLTLYLVVKARHMTVLSESFIAAMEHGAELEREAMRAK